MNFQQSNKRTW